MFSYYGSKTTIAHLYPPPRYSTIVEPFAGAAKYSLRYFDNDVILYDADERIVRIWKFLQSATPKDILSLPSEFKAGQTLNDFNLSDIERLSWGSLLATGIIHRGLKLH
jgi:site-specific DNA-adenine methylase